MQENRERLNMEEVARQVTELARPERVILFALKQNLEGETSSFKLCVVSDFCDRQKLEREIYLAIDSEVPFDVLVYSSEQWREQSEQRGSFAKKVAETGRVLYEK